jgi:hypothetical protein
MDQDLTTWKGRHGSTLETTAWQRMQHGALVTMMMMMLCIRVVKAMVMPRNRRAAPSTGKPCKIWSNTPRDLNLGT